MTTVSGESGNSKIGGGMVRWRKIPLWKRFGFVAATSYIVLAVGSYVLLRLLGVEGEGLMVLMIFFFPSFLLEVLFPKMDTHSNQIVFSVLMSLNVGFYFGVGALAGLIFNGWRK